MPGVCVEVYGGVEQGSVYQPPLPVKPGWVMHVIDVYWSETWQLFT